MDKRHQLRVAENESRARAHNERTREAFDEFRGDSTSPTPVICECALLDCRDMVRISRADYDRVRSNGRWFVVLPEHVLEGSERTIEWTDEFWIVEKLDHGGMLAEERA